uniref:Secreted protein n=1 Tax=Setaria digitata TaxID=48799 RepID=A0A915PSH5_9BILA
MLRATVLSFACTLMYRPAALHYASAHVWGSANEERISARVCVLHADRHAYICLSVYDSLLCGPFGQEQQSRESERERRLFASLI